VAAYLVCASAAFAQPRPNNDVDTARAHFRLGIASYTDNDFATALIEFKRAYAAAPNFRLLYNLGQVSQELRDYPAAEFYYQKYLREGGPAIDAPRKQEVEDELVIVRARIASVVVTCNVPGTEIFIDDVSVGVAPLRAPVRVSTGQRRLTGKVAGYSPITRVIDAAGGETLALQLDLLPANLEARTASGVLDANPYETRGSHVNPLALSLVIGTVVVGAGAGVFAYLAAHDASDYREALKHKTTVSELDALSDGAKTKALIGDVLLGVTVAGAVATTIVLVKQGMIERDATSLRVGLGRVQLTGSF
jgi:tetratricopeptide (TPR) repeat protein